MTNPYRQHFNLSSKYGVPKGARVLNITDTHLRDTDFKVIGNYVNVMNLNMMDLIAFAVENNVTHIFHTGDLYDKGYRSLDRSFSDMNICRKMSEAVNGNFYKAIGNHFYIERDNNPAMYLIQPHDTIRPKNPVFSETPVIKVVDELFIEGVQFSFFHYNKNDKMYVRRRRPDAVAHIGIYHDDTMVPSSVRQRLNMHAKVDSEYMQMIYANIDEAVIGHIHIPNHVQTIQVNGRQVSIDIPGSVCICKKNEVHTNIQLPIYDIYDGQYTKRYLDFNIRADKLKFYEKKEGPIISGDLSMPSLSEQSKAGIAHVVESQSFAYMNIEDYLLNEGFDSNAVEVIRKASKGELDMKEAIKIFVNKNTIEVASNG